MASTTEDVVECLRLGAVGGEMCRFANRGGDKSEIVVGHPAARTESCLRRRRIARPQGPMEPSDFLTPPGLVDGILSTGPLNVTASDMGSSGGHEQPNPGECSIHGCRYGSDRRRERGVGPAGGWAASHSHGGIVRGVVTSVETRPDFTTDIVLANNVVLRGDPPMSYPVHGAAGMPCEQIVDEGETILILYDIRGAEWPMPFPTFYVVAGADALGPKVVADGLGGTGPPTDTIASPAGSEDPPVGLALALIMVIAVFLGAGMVIRRTRPA
jgi:hypothetical protein